MTGDLTVDFDYIANNIQSYIDQENFFDILEKEDIPKVIEKTNLNSNAFKALLSQGKTKYNASKMYGFVRKCTISVNSLEELINVLKSYKKHLKLKSSGGLINYLEKYKADNITNSQEVSKLQNEIQNLKAKIMSLENEINQYKDETNRYKDETNKCKNEISNLKNYID
ncbi:hypothetical protein TVAG_256680 [Trichomonas vaginalis G3]|uniref:Uncharacterized protein n=1 Tax=Trichomonas vaginalis (strain ATCC PRA-98 / G3) TaxID=412133 RepID=A2FEX4_TRIV3|nr:EP4 subtype prostaglandin E2 receptor binding [Trichomonas vaginalis G3]EAX96528.1 hypothetical protein TVAG_256680 [Trichomonas vaginalis G3]KAI5541104.1 EP4 subtype prostaglandin E2 receptor binding [Trichomonas vaginalis G3]|eukprot:XP_001309458.1 hypothetical protein [Trichomonas vaginalis G3]